MQRRHHDCRTSTAALSTARCYEAGHMAGSDATEGQAVWQPGGAEEDSRLREGNRHLHLAHEEEEELDKPQGKRRRGRPRNSCKRDTEAELILCSWVIFVYVDALCWFYGCSFLCLLGCFNMIVWTPTAFECLICMRCLFLYLHLFSAVEHVSRGKAL